MGEEPRLRRCESAKLMKAEGWLSAIYDGNCFFVSVKKFVLFFLYMGYCVNASSGSID